MSHRSRIGVVCIDCKTEDLTGAVAFWSAMLGMKGEIDEAGKYAVFDDHTGYPRVLLQPVDHEPPRASRLRDRRHSDAEWRGWSGWARRWLGADQNLDRDARRRPGTASAWSARRRDDFPRGATWEG